MFAVMTGILIMLMFATMYKRQKGFTIVELLIVIVVIGILAAITIVAYGGIQSKARVAAVSAALSQASQKLAVYQVDNGNYPTSLATIGLVNSTSVSYSYNYDNSVTPSTYCLTATTTGTSYSATNSKTAPQSGDCSTNGLAVWWPLNGNANDLTGNNGDGVVNGATLVTGQKGQANGAYSFDGSTSNITRADSFGLKAGSVTMACWIYNPISPNKGAFIKIGNSDGYAIGIGNGSYNVSGSNLILLYENRRWIPTAATIPTGWHHVAVTIDSNSTPSAYLDGVLVGVYPGVGALAPTVPTSVGGYGVRYFNGYIDDVRVYNRALAGTEIQAIYSAGAQ